MRLAQKAIRSALESGQIVGASGVDKTGSNEDGARGARSGRVCRTTSGSSRLESSALNVLKTQAARLIANGEARPLLLEEVETLLTSKALIVDACRNVVRNSRAVVSLLTRPVLFALARALGEAWPGDVSRDILLARAFGAKHVDESHRIRLRVEIGRLRKEL